MTLERRKAFIHKIMGPPKRILEGDEYKHMMLVLNLMEPMGWSNNQRTITEEYLHDGRRYDVTYGVEDIPILEEIDL